MNGNQSNADGGNNGIQAMYVDQTTQTVYLGGAFLHWNGTTGSTHQSLIAFSFAPGSADRAGSPTGVIGDPPVMRQRDGVVDRAGRRRQPDHRLHRDLVPGGVTATTAGATSVTVPV